MGWDDEGDSGGDAGGGFDPAMRGGGGDGGSNFSDYAPGGSFGAGTPAQGQFQYDEKAGAENDKTQQAYWDKQFALNDAERAAKLKVPAAPAVGATGAAPATSAVAGGGGGGSKGGGGGPYIGYNRPDAFKPEAIPTAPEYKPTAFKPEEFKYTGPGLAIPEYKPPAEDKNYVEGQRSRYGAQGKHELGKQAREATLTTRNIDNPNARGKALEGIMAGFGKGLAGVMGEAGQAASRDAATKRSEELNTYATNWSAQGEMARDKYSKEFQTALMNFTGAQNAEMNRVNQENEAKRINLGNVQQANVANVNLRNQAKLADWNSSMDLYKKSPAIPGYAAYGR